MPTQNECSLSEQTGLATSEQTGSVTTETHSGAAATQGACETVEQTLNEQQAEARNRAMLQDDPFYITDDTIDLLAPQLAEDNAVIACQTNNLELAETYDITVNEPSGTDNQSLTLTHNVSMTCHSDGSQTPVTICNSRTQTIHEDDAVPGAAIHTLNAAINPTYDTRQLRNALAIANSGYVQRCSGRQYIHRFQNVIYDAQNNAIRVAPQPNRIVATTYRNAIQRTIDTNFILDNTHRPLNYLHNNLYSENGVCFNASALVPRSHHVNNIASTDNNIALIVAPIVSAVIVIAGVFALLITRAIRITRAPLSRVRTSVRARTTAARYTSTSSTDDEEERDTQTEATVVLQTEEQ